MTIGTITQMTTAVERSMIVAEGLRLSGQGRNRLQLNANASGNQNDAHTALTEYLFLRES